nr:esterase [Quercus suber]
MDGVSSLALLKFFLPQVPGLANTALWHTLGSGATSSKWDLRTAMTVAILRNIMKGGSSNPQPIGVIQKRTLRDPGIKGPVWIAKTTIPAPAAEDDGLEAAVFRAIEEMKITDIDYVKPSLAGIEVEWTGSRPGAKKDEPLPAISEEEKYKKLLAEPSRISETTILYFHGGAYYLADPSTHRALVTKLAGEIAGRVCSVRYRLAPQAAFPGQLLDAFMMYLSLLYPPPGSMHEPISAKSIVFGGDSAGGNLVFALLQLLLQLHRSSQNPTVRFHGKTVEVPLPAGVSANSGWFDIARSMPSIATNVKYDYLPPPRDDALSHFLKDENWPTDPPRGDLFCDLSLLDHPLVSVLGAESWKGSPPLWMCTGEEMLTDEDCVVARTAVSQGVKVVWEQYEAMPHCFAMLIPHLATSERCVKSWGAFARQCVEDADNVQTSGRYIHVKSGKEDVVQVESVTTHTVADARKYMLEAKQKRLAGFEKEGKSLPKPAL